MIEQVFQLRVRAGRKSKVSKSQIPFNVGCEIKKNTTLAPCGVKVSKLSQQLRRTQTAVICRRKLGWFVKKRNLNLYHINT